MEENFEEAKEENSMESSNTSNTNKTNKLKELVAKIPKHNWAIVSYILALLVIILLIQNFPTGVTGGVISETEAGDTAVSLMSSLYGVDFELTGVEKKGDLYEATLSYEGQDMPIYLSKDGQYIGSMSSLDELQSYIDGDSSSTDTPADVPKSDKPVVDSYIFSYCPYGTQFEKALVPVYDLLKDVADFNIVAIGAMHGEYEHQESLRQICVEENYGKDTLFAYLKAFNENSNVGTCNGDDACVIPVIQVIYATLGIDESKINSCMESDAEAIYEEQNAKASEMGVSGSPTLLINDVKVQVSRNPEAIKEAICSAFNDAPSECDTVLDSASASAGFGGGSGSSSSAAQC